MITADIQQYIKPEFVLTISTAYIVLYTSQMNVHIFLYVTISHSFVNVVLINLN